MALQQGRKVFTWNPGGSLRHLLVLSLPSDNEDWATAATMDKATRAQIPLG